MLADLKTFEAEALILPVLIVPTLQRGNAANDAPASRQAGFAATLQVFL